MKPRHQISRAAIELIERFEGYRSKAAQLPDGRWTIGYGHTLTAREGAAVSKEDAEALLIYDLIAVAHVINERTFTPLTQNQFDALCAFAFNIGVESFRRSAVLRRLNEGALIQAACAMELWRKADFEGERIVIDALVRRRAAEKTLFLTPSTGFIPVPTPVLQPNLDLDGLGGVPYETPTAVTAWMDGPVAGAARDDVAPFAEPEEPSAMKAAAEAVSARLATIFPDEPEEEAPEIAPEPEPAPEPTPEPEPEIEVPAPEPEPEIEPEIEAELVAADQVMELVAPEPEAPAIAPAPAPEPAPAPAPAPEPAPINALDEEPLRLLAEAVAAAQELETRQAEPALTLQPPAEAAGESTPDSVAADIRETVVATKIIKPFSERDFPSVLSAEPQDADYELKDRAGAVRAYLPVVAMAVIGGVILAGGVFWALVSQGGSGSGFWVGWLAGLAGIAILGRAVYLFLERLGQVGGGLDSDQDGH